MKSLMRIGQCLVMRAGCSLLFLCLAAGEVAAGETVTTATAGPGVPCGSAMCARLPERSENVDTVPLHPALIAAPGRRDRPRTVAAEENADADATRFVQSPSVVQATKPHWSGLPIFGPEAEARGFEIPLPFGIGVNYYREEQPFNINDLKVGIAGRAPVSVTGFVQLERVNTTQHSVTGRLDAWIFPFLNLYGIAGYTSGTMEGRVGLPEVPLLRIPAQELPLSISYEGPTFGGGITVAGGLKVSDWHALTAFLIADANYTVTPLSFTNENLFTDTNITALVFSSRLGVRGHVARSVHAALWAGAMYQDVSETLAGRATNGTFQFEVTQSPVAPWNAVIGGQIEVGKHVNLMVEGGIGTRSSILVGVGFRF